MVLPKFALGYIKHVYRSCTQSNNKEVSYVSSVVIIFDILNFTKISNIK